jgi:predicted heme/steroid binding protein
MLATEIHTTFFALLAVIVIAAHEPPVKIVNSGSTNTPGYTIIIEHNGSVHYYIAPRRVQVINVNGAAQQPSWTNGTAQLSHKTTKDLYSQIKRCEPFNKLPVEQCAKSVSFGFTLTLIYNGEATPDLTCPTNNKNLANLTTIVNRVISESKI